MKTNTKTVQGVTSTFVKSVIKHICIIYVLLLFFINVSEFYLMLAYFLKV